MRHTFLALPLVLSLVCGSVRAEGWPDFRGPTGQGHYEGKPLPLEWGSTKNVVWKQPVPGKGWSSPIVLKGRIYLTTAVPVADSKDNDHSLRALCLDAATGKVLWQKEVFLQDGSTAPRVHGKNSHASPSAVTDGERIYVHFGHQGTAALDPEGKILWRTTELKYAPVHGNGGSPIVVDDLLVLSCDGRDRPFVAALECQTGKVRWQTFRDVDAFKKFSFGTPLLIEVKGKKQVVSPGSHMAAGYEPATGKEIWRVRFEGYSIVPRPVYGHGLVFFSIGYDSPELWAVRPDGEGDITDTHVAWKLRQRAPLTPSPLLVGDELYVVADLGVATCLDARTGKVHWQERLRGPFSASPLYASGRIYLQNEDGLGVVLRPGKAFERLAENRVEGRTFASYAGVDGALYLRTEENLYRIEEKKER